MEASLYDSLQNYITKNIYPFHMPGHKGIGLDIENIMKIDITEIEGFDNLHHAEGVILKSQELTAQIFGAKQSFFLINGSTCGNIAAIMATCNPNDKVLVARNCHKSVYSGMIYSGVNPVYIEPQIVMPYGLIGGIDPLAIENQINGAKAVIITSPTYEGFTSDIECIADIVHKNNAILIVDEAHGAHFKFNKEFPRTALEQGADIVIQSLHKTLPSLTQTAVLHIQGNRVDVQRLKQSLAMVQSSSPSYILMSSIDLCKSQLSKLDFDKFINKVINFRNSLSDTKSLKLIGKELEYKFNINKIDISRLVIYCCTNDINGLQLDNTLLNDYRLRIEMNTPNYIIAISTICDTDEGFERLSKAIHEIDIKLQYSKIKNNCDYYVKPRVVLNPREAMFKQKISIPIKESINSISGEFVIPYPPGIPILAPGEIITDKIIDIINNCKANSISILGTKDYFQNEIQIIK